MIEEGANINAKVERIDKTVRQEKRPTQRVLFLKNLRKKGPDVLCHNLRAIYITDKKIAVRVAKKIADF